MNIKEQIRAEIERRLKRENEILWNAKKRGTYPSPSCEYNLLTLTSLRDFLDTIPDQPVSDHHEIEVEFRGEKVTINREFYRDGEMNYSTSEQDDNAIWSALRAWCEKKGITPFELYPKHSEQPVEGLEEEISRTYHDGSVTDTEDIDHTAYENIARHFAEWGAEHLKR